MMHENDDVSINKIASGHSPIDFFSPLLPEAASTLGNKAEWLWYRLSPVNIYALAC